MTETNIEHMTKIILYKTFVTKMPDYFNIEFFKHPIFFLAVIFTFLIILSISSLNPIKQPQNLKWVPELAAHQNNNSILSY